MVQSYKNTDIETNGGDIQKEHKSQIHLHLWHLADTIFQSDLQKCFDVPIYKYVFTLVH